MRLCVVQLAPGHGSSTTIAGAIALPGCEISYAADEWSVQSNVWLLPVMLGLVPATRSDADVLVYFQRRVPLKHSRLGVQTCTLLILPTRATSAATGSLVRCWSALVGEPPLDTSGGALDRGGRCPVGLLGERSEVGRTSGSSGGAP